MQARRGGSAMLCALIAVLFGGCSLFKTTAASTTTTSTFASTTSTTTPATSTTAPATSTTSSSTTTTTVALASCTRSWLTIKPGRSSGAAGTIALGFVITNTSSSPCTVHGYPIVSLVPASGTVHAVVGHIGSAPLVSLAGGGGAGFALEYSDEAVNGQTSCPRIDDVDVTLPDVVGAPVTVPAHFCPYGQPDVSVSAVLSLGKYRALVG